MSAIECVRVGWARGFYDWVRVNWPHKEQSNRATTKKKKRKKTEKERKKSREKRDIHLKHCFITGVRFLWTATHPNSQQQQQPKQKKKKKKKKKKKNDTKERKNDRKEEDRCVGFLSLLFVS